MRNLPLLVATIVGTLLFIVAVAFFFSQWSAAQDKTASEAQANVLLAQTSNSRGPAEAPITIVEFSDLQCPACKAVQPLVKQVWDRYPDKVRLVFRHYPLFSLHQYAQVAAQAAEVVAASGKFWEFHDKLFEKQEEWSNLSSQDAVLEAFETYAKDLGIDTTGFKEKILSEDIKARVLKDVADGNSLNISSTPTFYINNKRVPAPQQLMSIVESLIQK